MVTSLNVLWCVLDHFFSFLFDLLLLLFWLFGEVKDFIVGWCRCPLDTMFSVCGNGGLKTFRDAELFAFTGTFLGIQDHESPEGAVTGCSNQRAQTCDQPGGSTKYAGNTCAYRNK